MRNQIAAYIRHDALLSRFFEPFLFEELPAQDQSAKQAYLDEVSKDDIYLLLMGEQYGYEDEQGISPTEREFDAATSHHVYRIAAIKQVDKRHAKEQQFISKIEQQVIRNTFSTIEELKSIIYASLIEYMTNHGLLANGPFDSCAHPTATIADLDKDKIAWFVGIARERRQFPLAYSEANLPQILRSLHLLTDDNHLKNAALLLFAKDTQEWFITATVKCAQFYGTEKRKPILTQHIYSGTVFDVVDEAVAFVMSHVDVRVGERTKSAQVDVTPEIPTQAVTEAIVNAVVHRDYTSNGSVQVELYANRLVVWNPGQLPHGLTIAQLAQEHDSMPHNPILAHAVYMAGYIEQIGTGTTDVIDLCKQAGLKVEFSQDGNFTTIIYRPVNEEEGQVAGQVAGQVVGQVTGQAIGQLERLVLAIDLQTLTRQEIMSKLELKGRDNFRVNYLEPAIRLGYVSKLYPDSSNRPDQAYYLTKKGKDLIKRIYPASYPAR